MDELLARLQSMGNIASKVENTALRAGAEVLKDSISKKAPRSSLNKKHLADHIGISSVKRREHIKIIEVGPKPDYFYGAFLEWGTSKMTAKPFMGPAADESQSGVNQAIATIVKGALKL